MVKSLQRHVLAAVLLCGAMLVACKQGDEKGSRVKIRTLPAHAGSRWLTGGPILLASFEPAENDEGPGTVRISRGDGPIERTVTGLLSGVAGTSTFVLMPDGENVAVYEVPLTGPGVEWATVPDDHPWGWRASTVVNHGAAIVVYTGAIRVVENGSVREIKLGPGDRVVQLAGNPTGPEVFAIVERASTPDSPAGAWLMMFDSSTERVLWQEPMDPYPGADLGTARFVAGDRLLVQFRDGVMAFDRGRGTPSVHWPGPRVAFSGGVFAENGRHLADVNQIGTGHGSLLNPTCVVDYFGDTVASKQHWTEQVASFPGFCSDGPAITFVGDELWLAPPSR